jgi:hypothetical protein
MICSEPTTTEHPNAMRLEQCQDIFTVYVLQLRYIVLIYFLKMAVEPADGVQRNRYHILCQPPTHDLPSSNHSPGKSLPQRIRSSKLRVSAPHDDDDAVAVRGPPPPPLSAVSNQNLRNSIRISSSESVAPMYRASPATRGASASVLPPMWASMIPRREKRRVFPLTTS